MIKTKGLTKVFTTEEVETTALNNVDIEIKEGEFLSIMGPSGCGKSTLLNIMGLLDNPTSGEYYFLMPWLTVFENVELPLLYLGVPAGERKQRVHEVLERMEIMHREKHFPQQLSGGQQQRVAVGRAIIANPKLILADEPTGNLDSAHGNEVMKMLLNLNEAGATIIMVTHSPTYADYGTRVMHLFDGQILTENYIEKFHV